jgi:hypothetical protein
MHQTEETVDYVFSYELTEADAPIATLFGAARIVGLHGSGTWAIAGITLETKRGLKPAVELTDPWLYARIALWLLNARRTDIDAEWRDYTARRRPVEGVLS